MGKKFKIGEPVWVRSTLHGISFRRAIIEETYEDPAWYKVKEPIISSYPAQTSTLFKIDDLEGIQIEYNKFIASLVQDKQEMAEKVKAETANTS